MAGALFARKNKPVADLPEPKTGHVGCETCRRPSAGRTRAPAAVNLRDGAVVWTPA